MRPGREPERDMRTGFVAVLILCGAVPAARAAASGRKESLFLFANTVADLSSGMGCSTVVVEKERSTTGGPLFGRTFDWLPTKGITEHTLVVVYKGEGKRAFAAITVAPIQ